MTNLVILAGNIGADPETRTTQSGTAITNFSLCTSRPKRDAEGKVLKDAKGYVVTDDEWHRCTAFNGVGNNAAKVLKKGMKVMVKGRIHYTQWEDREGNKRYGCEIILEEFVDVLKWPSDKTREGDTIDDSAPF